jgi:thioredoxin-like negative regulator of GroEL
MVFWKDIDSPIEMKKRVPLIRKYRRFGTPIIVFFYMTGCVHCDHLKESWNQLPLRVPSLQKEGSVLVMSMNHELFPMVASYGFGERPTGFPEVRALHKEVLSYDGKRDVDSLAQWIQQQKKKARKTRKQREKRGKTRRRRA